MAENVNGGNVDYTVTVTDQGGGLEQTIEKMSKFTKRINETTGSLQRIQKTTEKITQRSNEGTRTLTKYTTAIKNLGATYNKSGVIFKGNPAPQKMLAANNKMAVDFFKQKKRAEEIAARESAKAAELQRKANIKFWADDRKARAKQIAQEQKAATLRARESAKRESEYRKRIALINKEEQKNQALVRNQQFKQTFSNQTKSPELQKMAAYYKQQEISSRKVSLEKAKQVEQEKKLLNIAKIRQATAIKGKSPELKKMAEFYKQQEKTARLTEKMNQKNIAANKRLNAIREKGNAKVRAHYLKQIALISKMRFAFSAMRRGYTMFTQGFAKIAEIEQKMLSADAVLSKYGSQIGDITKGITESTGLSVVTVRGELAKSAGQMQSQGFDQDKIVDMLKKTGDIAIGIAGSRGITIKRAYEQLENIIAGEPVSLDRAGFQFDTSDLKGVSAQEKTTKVLERMETYLSKTEASEIYLNNKTISQQAEAFKAVFINAFSYIYLRFGNLLGKPIAAARNFLDGAFSGDNIKFMNRGMNDLLVYFDKLSKAPEMKFAGEALGRTGTFLVEMLPEILNGGFLYVLFKLGKFIWGIIGMVLEFTGLGAKLSFALKWIFKYTLPALVTGIKTFFVSMFTFLGGISAPVWLTIAAIVAVVALLYLLWKNWDKVSEWSVKMFEKSKKVMSEFWENLTAWFMGIYEGYLTWVDGMRAKFRKALGLPDETGVGLNYKPLPGTTPVKTIYDYSGKGEGNAKFNPLTGQYDIPKAYATKETTNNNSQQSNNSNTSVVFNINSSDPKGVVQEIGSSNLLGSESTNIMKGGRRY